MTDEQRPPFAWSRVRGDLPSGELPLPTVRLSDMFVSPEPPGDDDTRALGHRIHEAIGETVKRQFREQAEAEGWSPGEPVLRDPVDDIRRMMDLVTEYRGTVASKLIADPRVPRGRWFKQWNTRGEFVVWCNRDELDDALAKLPRQTFPPPATWGDIGWYTGIPVERVRLYCGYCGEPEHDSTLVDATPNLRVRIYECPAMTDEILPYKVVADPSEAVLR